VFKESLQNYQKRLEIELEYELQTKIKIARLGLAYT
jgi:hypothetical protein